MITCIIDGVDISSYIQFNGLTEDMRKVTGPNNGTTLNGTYIEDLIAVKYDPTFTTKPLPPDKLKELNNLMKREYVTMTYSSFYQATDVTAEFAPRSSTAVQKMYNGTPVLDGLTLSFTQR